MQKIMPRLWSAPLLLVPFTTFFGTVALLWDSWWHGAMGRDSFFIPPHDLLYVALLVGFGAVVWQIRVDRRTPSRGFHNSPQPPLTLRGGVSVRLLIAAITSLLIFASAPFDNLWHNIFGPEQIASLFVLWSPPHLLALLSSVVGGVAIYGEILRRFPDKYFIHLLQAVPIFTTAQFLVLPFQPISLHHVGGFAGQAVLSLVAVLFLLSLARTTPFRGIATLISLIYMSLFAIGFVGHELAAEVAKNVPLHPHPAYWTLFFSALVGGLVIDGLRAKNPTIVGSIAAAASTLVFYPFARYFLDDPQFFYDNREVVIAIVSGTVGGLIGGWFVPRVQRWFVTPSPGLRPPSP